MCVKTDTRLTVHTVRVSSARAAGPPRASSPLRNAASAGCQGCSPLSPRLSQLLLPPPLHQDLSGSPANIRVCSFGARATTRPLWAQVAVLYHTVFRRLRGHRGLAVLPRSVSVAGFPPPLPDLELFRCHPGPWAWFCPWPQRRALIHRSLLVPGARGQHLIVCVRWLKEVSEVVSDRGVRIHSLKKKTVSSHCSWQSRSVKLP